MKRKPFLVKERCPSCWHSSSARRHSFALCAARRLLCSSSSARRQFSALCASGFGQRSSARRLLCSMRGRFQSRISPASKKCRHSAAMSRAEAFRIGILARILAPFVLTILCSIYHPETVSLQTADTVSHNDIRIYFLVGPHNIWSLYHAFYVRHYPNNTLGEEPPRYLQCLQTQNALGEEPPRCLQCLQTQIRVRIKSYEKLSRRCYFPR